MRRAQVCGIHRLEAEVVFPHVECGCVPDCAPASHASWMRQDTVGGHSHVLSLAAGNWNRKRLNVPSLDFLRFKAPAKLIEDKISRPCWIYRLRRCTRPPSKATLPACYWRHRVLFRPPGSTPRWMFYLLTYPLQRIRKPLLVGCMNSNPVILRGLRRMRRTLID
jgi:hypothetical protein